METALWILGLALGAFFLDRVLLWVESRGWIYYRRNKPGRGASTYHLFEWNAAFDPTMRQVQEERIKEDREEEESGAPPGPDGFGEGGDGGDGSTPSERKEPRDRRAVVDPGNGKGRTG